MGKSKKLDLATRGSIVTLRDEGYSYRCIAERVQSKNTRSSKIRILGSVIFARNILMN